jgi:protein-L-isoaspartate(D-aspartate) O-methyltransferase
MIDLSAYRRYFAEEIEAVARLQTRALVDAFAAVPRERFLRPGPWTMLAEHDYAAGAAGNAPAATRATADADPRRVYHNIAVAIDPERRLFNGQPSTLGAWIDALALAPGTRVLHVGSGLGYYTAVMAHIVAPHGRVVAYEVDPVLAAEAARNLADDPAIDLRHGDGSDPGGPFDAILVNAGVTHPLDTWLDALADGGRMVLPVTATMAAMGPTIGKGLTFLVTRQDAQTFTARMAGLVAVYSAVGVRDSDMDAAIGKALMTGPNAWGRISRLRRDRHDIDDACWLHGKTCCLSTV